ncbi:unnamed protein product [Paramecium pentaurelia]|uniref:PB1 domain-containing protein n=1 Tax=Paramecium pentaurelia TaxID=43138 RepID=A0A8S1V6X1_9CILI|nr:unnamed protein product [Paramecium pentaurelia]
MKSIKIAIQKDVYICSRELNRFEDLQQEYQSLCQSYQNKDELIFYFVDEEGDKVVITNDYDLEDFKKQDPKFLKIRVEFRDRNNQRERIYNREITKDAMKQKIMQLLQQY